MLNKPLVYFDNYSAVCESGMTQWDTSLVVDVLPDSNDWPPDSFAMPLTVGNQIVVVTGWDQASTTLYIDLPNENVSGPVTVFCGINSEALLSKQSLQVMSHSIASVGEVALVATGALNFVNMLTAGIVRFDPDGYDNIPGRHRFAQEAGSSYRTKIHRGVTRIVLYDYNNTQPAITWQYSPVGYSMSWADGVEAQFTAGYRVLEVEVIAFQAENYQTGLAKFRKYA